MTKLTLDYARVADSRAINRNAISVTRNKGEHYNSTPTRNGMAYHWENRPKFIPQDQINPLGQGVAKKLIGKRVGRVICIGLFKERITREDDRDTPALWLVRCDCGCYETRLAKQLFSYTHDMCGTCYHFVKAKKAYDEGERR